MRGRGEAQRRIQHAPPVVARARAQLYYKRVVFAPVEYVAAVLPRGKFLPYRFCRACVRLAAFGKFVVRSPLDFAKIALYGLYRLGFAVAFGKHGREIVRYFLDYLGFYGLIFRAVAVCADMYAYDVVGG